MSDNNQIPLEEIPEDITEIVDDEKNTQTMSIMDDDDPYPEHDINKIANSGIEELQAGGDQIAALLKLRYAQDVQILVKENELLKSVFLYVATLLNVNMPVSNINVETGEVVNYSVKVTSDGVYSRKETNYIAVLIKKRVEEHSKKINAINHTVQQLQNAIEQKDIELKNKDAQIRTLGQKPKYSTIEKKPYVLAYLGNKGSYFYLANKPRKDGKGMRLGKSLDFSLAIKYDNPQEALSQLISILKDRNNTVPSAPKLQVFSANLIPAVVSMPSDFEAIKEQAEKYEELMKASGHGEKIKSKVGISKNIKSKIKAKTKGKIKKHPKVK